MEEDIYKVVKGGFIIETNDGVTLGWDAEDSEFVVHIPNEDEDSDGLMFCYDEDDWYLAYEKFNICEQGAPIGTIPSCFM